MSLLIVDKVQPNIGQDFEIDGNLVVTGNLNGTPISTLTGSTGFTGNTSADCINNIWAQNINPCDGQLNINGSLNVLGADGIIASYFSGDGGGLTNLPSSVFTGNTSGDCIQDLWVQYLMGCNGTLNIVGDVNVSGSLSATTLYGNGSNITQDITEISLSGSGSTTATTYLNYGINIVVNGDVNNFVARLPIVPVKGRTVTVINNCGISMVLYPSMPGGSINGVVNGVAIIPSDNKAYSFTCYENPAPGSWSGAFLAATGQYDSGEITCDMVGPNWDIDVIAASDPSRFTQAPGFAGASSWSYNGLNNAFYLFSPGNSAPWKPAIPWSYITKLTVYTNMTQLPSQVAIAGICHGTNTNYYSVGSTTFLKSGNGVGGIFGDPQFLSLTSILSGTSTTTGTTTGSTSGLTAHAGEPGTIWGELIYNTGGGQPYNIGDKFIQTGTFNLGTPYGTVTADQWTTTYINFCLQPRFQGNGIKFRFLIDYIL